MRRFFLGLGRFDDLLAEVVRDLLVVREAPRERALAPGHRAQIGRVVRDLGERDLGFDQLAAASDGVDPLGDASLASGGRP